MIRATLAEVATWVGGELLEPEAAEQGIVGASTDTRTLTDGQLFVALSGPNFDAHDMLDRAAAGGAVAAIVARRCEVALPQILVADTRAALGRLAAAWRARHDIPVVAVTGSNGKTTTKEMIAAILAQAGPVLATRGNLNNEIGLPLTLLELGPEHVYAVVEMGANHAGEIAALCAIAQPTVGVVTNAARAHLEGFGSIEGVARAKGELYQGLAEGGTAIINADDAHAPLWRELADRHRILSFGLEATSDLSARDVASRLEEEGGALRFELLAPQGEVAIAQRFVGRHNVSNALAAAAVAVACGLDLGTVADGLAAARPVPGRLRILEPRAGLVVVDDCYNANPDSVAAALDVLAELPGEHWFVFADLLETGELCEQLHREVGERVRSTGVDRLLTTGELARAATEVAGGEHHADLDSLCAALDQGLAAAGGEVTVLVKGSNAMGLSQVVAHLSEPAPATGAEVG